jgi:hypothetical protein
LLPFVAKDSRRGVVGRMDKRAARLLVSQQHSHTLEACSAQRRAAFHNSHCQRGHLHHLFFCFVLLFLSPPVFFALASVTPCLCAVHLLCLSCRRQPCKTISTSLRLSTIKPAIGFLANTLFFTPTINQDLLLKEVSCLISSGWQHQQWDATSLSALFAC